MVALARKKSETGDCYEAALKALYRLCSDGDTHRYKLVHAEIVGQGPIEGLLHGHAFVVDIKDDMVIDESNGRHLHMDLEMYAAFARMHVASNWHIYTFKQACMMAVKSGTYGPWDLETSTGL
jgi:hypothetical protein